MSDASRRPVDLPRARAPEPQRIGPAMSFRARLTLGLVAGAVLPLAGFGLVLIGTEVVRTGEASSTLVSVVLFVLAAAIIVAVLFAFVLANNLTAPLRAVSKAVERATAGDLSARVEVAGEDELARLVESHNRLASDLERRNHELGRILLAIGETSPRDGLERLVEQATRSARAAFGMIDARIVLGDPTMVPVEEDIPGEARPVRAVLALPDERVGVLVGHLPATRTLGRRRPGPAGAVRERGRGRDPEHRAVRPGRAPAAAARRARPGEGRVPARHQPQPPDAADEHPRVRRADRHGAAGPAARRSSSSSPSGCTASSASSWRRRGSSRGRSARPRRCSRSRRASGARGTRSAPRTSRSSSNDEAAGWLAIADPDQLDQVLWALLDNSARYAGGAAIRATVAPRPDAGQLAVTIADGGPGVRPEDRDRIFERYERGAAGAGAEGTGLGLYVSRSLCQAMGGDLVLEPAAAGHRRRVHRPPPGRAAGDRVLTAS